MKLGGAFLLGVGVTVAALAFGSRPLGVVGVGLLLAAGAARIWAGLVRGPVVVAYEPGPEAATEGDRVRLGIAAERASRVPVGSAVVHGRLGRLGPFECRLEGHGRRAAGELYLGRIPRGHFPITDTHLVLGDHLGLETVSLPVDLPGTAIVVYPRLVALEAVFSDAGRLGGSGRRLLLRRPAGFDFHSVREYTQGESLRRVHWPTTARRGQLMVKELEDAPRDTVAVLLDADPAGAAGEPPESSFDEAVRATGSVLRAYAARGRKATLVTTGRRATVVQITSLEGDFRAALSVLAAAEPDASQGLARWIRQEQAPLGSAGELVVVTANLEPAAIEALLAVATRRLVSVVWIDAPSYAGRPTRAATGPLRLSAAGIPVAVVRRGEDLRRALDLPRQEALSRA
ncbi:MAG: DUF58 domain-containing protein [Gaiellaceae bacterium]